MELNLGNNHTNFYKRHLKGRSLIRYFMSLLPNDCSGIISFLNYLDDIHYNEIYLSHNDSIKAALVTLLKKEEKTPNDEDIEFISGSVSCSHYSFSPMPKTLVC